MIYCGQGEHTIRYTTDLKCTGTWFLYVLTKYDEMFKVLQWNAILWDILYFINYPTITNFIYAITLNIFQIQQSENIFFLLKGLLLYMF
jgi:hypothetical protein